MHADSHWFRNWLLHRWVTSLSNNFDSPWLNLCFFNLTVGFTPNATMETAHHMLIYGCEEPGSEEEVWNCGEMAVKTPGLKSASPCREGSQVTLKFLNISPTFHLIAIVVQIIYAWAHDAPALQLPKDVGFHVGGSSRIKYIVLQVHYASVEKFKGNSFASTSATILFLWQFLHFPKIFSGTFNSLRDRNRWFSRWLGRLLALHQHSVSLT